MALRRRLLIFELMIWDKSYTNAMFVLFHKNCKSFKDDEENAFNRKLENVFNLK